MRLASTNRSALAIGGEHGVLRLRAAPVDARGNAQPRSPALELCEQRPAADMHEAANGRSRRQQSPAPPADRRSLSWHGAADRQDRHRSQLVACRRARAGCGANGGKRVDVDAVIDELDLAGRQSCEVLAAARVQVTAQCACAQLLALLPLGRGPDVLGVRRDAPAAGRASSQHSAHRGRRVQEMRVEMADVRAGSSAARTSAWPKRRDAVGRRVAPRDRRASRARAAR